VAITLPLEDQAATIGVKWCQIMKSLRDHNIACEGYLEKGDKGTYHYQAWIKAAGNYRISTLNKRIGRYWYMPVRDRVAWSTYIRKIATKVDAKDPLFERLSKDNQLELKHGTMPKPELKRGARTDVASVFSYARDSAVSGMPRDEIVKNCIRLFPDEYGKFYKGVDVIIASSSEKYQVKCPKPGDEWKWQKELLDKFVDPCDSGERIFHFVVSPEGDSGKSTLVKLFRRDHKDCVVQVDGDNVRDMAMTISLGAQNMHIAVCDITRTAKAGKIEAICELFECVSNEFIYSGKFLPVSLTLKRPHIVILANKLPENLDKMISADRIMIYRVHRPLPYGSGLPTKIYKGAAGFHKYLDEVQNK
jgi:hypothetical protein